MGTQAARRLTLRGPDEQPRLVWGTPFFGGGGRRGGWSWPLPGGGSSSDGKKVLERLSRETGGRMFVVSGRLPIGQIYQQIEDELRNQYNLGYTPDGAVAVGEYRRIQVGTKRSDLTVQSRDGYYASRQVAAVN